MHTPSRDEIISFKTKKRTPMVRFPKSFVGSSKTSDAAGSARARDFECFLDFRSGSSGEDTAGRLSLPLSSAPCVSVALVLASIAAATAAAAAAAAADTGSSTSEETDNCEPEAAALAATRPELLDWVVDWGDGLESNKADDEEDEEEDEERDAETLAGAENPEIESGPVNLRAAAASTDARGAKLKEEEEEEEDDEDDEEDEPTVLRPASTSFNT
jgi:hypothetical protein